MPMSTTSTQDPLTSGCSYLPALVPMRFPLPGLPSPVKDLEASQTLRYLTLPRQPRKEVLGLTHLKPSIWHCKASGLSSEAQGSLLQSGQMLRHLVGHQDSIQSSDFAPSSDCLVSHIPSGRAPPQ